MKCKKHQNDYTIGVCASCLRERLFALISDQARDEHKELEEHQHRPLILPRSVSPYACRRNFSSANLRHHGQMHHSMSEQRFFATPQAWTSTGDDVVHDGDGMKKKKKSRFSVISKLFRSKSDKVRMEATMAASNSGDSDAISSASPSWFTTMLSTNKKKKSRLFTLHKSVSRAADSRGGTNGHRDRGPEACEDEDSFERCSGYSSESSYGYKKTPRKSVESARRSGAGLPSHSRNVSGLSNSSLNPLVRASSNQKGMLTQFSDIRLPAKTQLSSAPSLCSNRSRKHGDYGRLNHDH